jgi:N-hydroxyarylamine O-acetyltransferase
MTLIAESVHHKDQAVDVQAYLKRINFNGEHKPTLDTLKALHLKHTLTIPFENLNPLLRIPVDLELRALEEKLVFNKRGGYCFEHNLLFAAILRSFGFEVRGLAARVMWNLPESTVIARGHMLLQVKVDGIPYIADVGFGGLTLTAPLLFKTGIAQETPHESFKITTIEDEFILHAQVKGEWKPLYRFGSQEYLPQDYEVSSYYLSNNPKSHFISTLIAARPTLQGRYALRNNELSIHHLNGISEKHAITSVAELREKLETLFDIYVPPTDNAEEIFSQIVNVTVQQ